MPKPSQHAVISLTGAAMFLTLTVACKGDPEPPQTPPAEAARTVLVYMQANNSLGSPVKGNGFDDSDLDEITAASQHGFGQSRVLVYHQPAYDGGNARLYEATADRLHEIAHYDNSNSSVSEARMLRVIADTKKLAPAKSYGIVLWSHATGWWNDGIDQPSSKTSIAEQRSFGVDSPVNDTRMTMSISSLARVLNGQQFEFIYFDCCYMASVEVAYQLRHATDYIIASAAEMPSPGMPYDKVLPLLTAPTIDYAKVGETVFNHYDTAYIPPTASVPTQNRPPESFGCTLSVIDTRELPLLAQTIRQIYSRGASLPADVADGTRPLQQYAPRTAPGNYCDLAHYINRLSGVSDLDRATATALIDRIVVFRGATPAIDMVNRFDIGNHCGLSVYVPEIAGKANSHNYNQLDWYAHTANPNDK